MNKCVLLFLVCLLQLGSAKAGYDIAQNPLADDSVANSRLNYYLKNIHIDASEQQKQRMIKWLNQIAMVEKGQQTLSAIAQSGHQLTIIHAPETRVHAGKTVAPLTQDLINGKGASVVIKIDINMPDTGTHWVYNDKKELIEFNAIQNIYHELAHAMHQMQGTWRYFNSEAQAIEEENIFRKQLAALNNHSPTQRYGKNGLMIHDHQISSIIE